MKKLKQKFYCLTINPLSDEIEISTLNENSRDEAWEIVENESHNLDGNWLLTQKQFNELAELITTMQMSGKGF